jgi:hypothetical protein
MNSTMRTLFIILFLLYFSNSFAQFAKVIDKDGYVNLRENANSKSKIIGRIESNEIVYISNKDNDDENWSYINYERKKGAIFSKYISGYIHNSRLKRINSFLLIPSVEDNQEGTNFICCGLEVEIKSEKFDFTKNKKYFKKFAGYYTYKNKYAFGALGIFPPKSNYHSIAGYIEGKHFEIPQNEIENLFNINNNLSECYFDNETKMLYIVLENSDGSDTYNALLMIENGKYKEIKINDDN